MPDAKRIFLTGGTGFLGSHLAQALLEKGNRVIVLARKSTSQTARQRVVEILGRVSSGQLGKGVAERLEVLEGDVSLPLLGLDSSAYDYIRRHVEEVWHSAASLSFLEDDRQEIFRMNVDGTRQVLALASGTGPRRLHHISTAYVAGNRTGIAREDELDVGQTFRNPYEASKCEAEKLLRAAHESGAVRATIYRPSIVIGNSVSGKATHFHGVYAFIRGLWAVTRRLRQGNPGSDFVDLSLRIRGSETSTLNFVPIDFVVSGIMKLAELAGVPVSGVARTFHLTNPVPTPNWLWLGVVCRQLRVRGIRLAEEKDFEDEPMTRMEALFHRQMTFYAPYLSTEPVFDRSAVEDALSSSAIRCPGVTEEFAAKMTGWYIDLLNGAREPRTAAGEQA